MRVFKLCAVSWEVIEKQLQDPAGQSKPLCHCVFIRFSVNALPYFLHCICPYVSTVYIHCTFIYIIEYLCFRRHLITKMGFCFTSSRITFCPSPVPTTASTNQQSPTCGSTPYRFGRWSAPTCRCRRSTRLQWEWSVQPVNPPLPCVSTDKSCLLWSVAYNEQSQLAPLNWVIKNAVKDAGFNGTDTCLLPLIFGCMLDTKSHSAYKTVCHNISSTQLSF